MAIAQKAEGLRITMAARAAASRGFAFSPREDSFADADVVLNEILHLPTPPEPIVLRVAARGGRQAERERVEGDWLCDAALEEPRRIPLPAWSYNDEAAVWSQVRPWLEAWETCEDARWMLYAAARVGVDRRRVVRAACACARTVLDQTPAVEERFRRAIETAEAWTRGQATLDEVRQVASAAAYAAYAASTTTYAAAAYAASAATEAASSASSAAADYADYAASTAALAAAYAPDGVARRRALARLAEVVRGEIATLAVLRATTKRAP